jgi:spore coat protein U-like protein
LELDGGGAADVAARKLRSGTNVLNYNLYRDSNRTALFGTGTNARTATLTGVSSGIFSVFGRIPKSQAVPVGTYTDTVNITLTF